MTARRWLPAAVATVVAGVLALAAWLVTVEFDTSLDLQVVDRVSGSWIWDTTVVLQGRELRLFYQGDQPPVWQRLTRLAPGAAELRVTAPGYVPLAVPVQLRRGQNRLEQPLRLAAKGIPGLERFVVFDRTTPDGVELELRPVGSDGQAIRNHPTVDLRIVAQASVQMLDGAPVTEATPRGYRGELLYRGPVAWRWLPRPETVFRYSAFIPAGALRPHPAPLLLLDYLILVPTDHRVTAAALDEVVAQALAAGDAQELQATLADHAAVAQSFSFTAPNVRRPGR